MNDQILRGWKIADYQILFDFFILNIHQLKFAKIVIRNNYNRYCLPYQNREYLPCFLRSTHRSIEYCYKRNATSLERDLKLQQSSCLANKQVITSHLVSWTTDNFIILFAIALNPVRTHYIWLIRFVNVMIKATALAVKFYSYHFCPFPMVHSQFRLSMSSLQCS